MNVWTTLLWKEWRDQRALLIAAAIIGPFLLVLIALVAGLSPGEGTWMRPVVIPAVSGLLGLALACDLFALDHANGLARTLARLPLSTLRLMLAKLAFLALALLALELWLTLFELGRSALFPELAVESSPTGERSGGGFAVSVRVWIGVSLLSAVAAGAVLRRGFASVLCGVAVLCLPFLASVDLSTFGRELRTTQALVRVWTAEYPFVLVPVALLVTLFFAARVRGFAVQSSVRRAASGGLAGLFVLGGPVALGRLPLNVETRLTPGDPTVRISCYSTFGSPNGRYVALAASRDRTRFGLPELSQVWIVELATGELRVLGPANEGPAGMGMRSMNDPWARDGRLLVWSNHPLLGARFGNLRWVDVARGTDERFSSFDAYFEAEGRWWKIQGLAEGEYSVGTREDGQHRVVRARQRPIALPARAGFVWISDEGHLMRAALGDAPPVALGGSRDPLPVDAVLRCSPDGRVLLLRSRRGAAYMAVSDGSLILRLLEGWSHLDWTGREREFATARRDVPEAQHALGFRCEVGVVSKTGVRRVETDPDIVHLTPLGDSEWLGFPEHRGTEVLRLDANLNVVGVIYAARPDIGQPCRQP